MVGDPVTRLVPTVENPRSAPENDKLPLKHSLRIDTKPGSATTKGFFFQVLGNRTRIFVSVTGDCEIVN